MEPHITPPRLARRALTSPARSGTLALTLPLRGEGDAFFSDYAVSAKRCTADPRPVTADRESLSDFELSATRQQVPARLEAALAWHSLATGNLPHV